MSSESSPWALRHHPGVLTLAVPPSERAPLVVEVPRSGRQYPNEFQVACTFTTLHAYVSMYVEEIYGRAPEHGVPLLWANFPNSWIDLNRSLEDLDPALLAEPWPTPLEPGDKSLRLGTGLIHKWGKDDLPIYDRKLTVAEVMHRIDRYYRPYHDLLGELIQANMQEFGASWHISCHCMATVGPRWSHDKGQPRKDFCVSDLHGQTCDAEFMTVCKEAFEAEGFSCSVNDPFVGGESIRRHSDPKGRRNSIQFEMIKGLYMDEDTWARTERFDSVRDGVGRVIGRIAAYCRDAARRSSTS
jgi:N-formylglutamate deformylase